MADNLGELTPKEVNRFEKIKKDWNSRESTPPKPKLSELFTSPKVDNKEQFDKAYESQRPKIDEISQKLKYIRNDAKMDESHRQQVISLLESQLTAISETVRNEQEEKQVQKAVRKVKASMFEDEPSPAPSSAD